MYKQENELKAIVIITIVGILMLIFGCVYLVLNLKIK